MSNILNFKPVEKTYNSLEDFMYREDSLYTKNIPSPSEFNDFYAEMNNDNSSLTYEEKINMIKEMQLRIKFYLNEVDIFLPRVKK